MSSAAPAVPATGIAEKTSLAATAPMPGSAASRRAWSAPPTVTSKLEVSGLTAEVTNPASRAEVNANSSRSGCACTVARNTSRRWHDPGHTPTRTSSGSGIVSTTRANSSRDSSQNWKASGSSREVRGNSNVTP